MDNSRMTLINLKMFKKNKMCGLFTYKDQHYALISTLQPDTNLEYDFESMPATATAALHLYLQTLENNNLFSLILLKDEKEYNIVCATMEAIYGAI